MMPLLISLRSRTPCFSRLLLLSLLPLRPSPTPPPASSSSPTRPQTPHSAQMNRRPFILLHILLPSEKSPVSFWQVGGAGPGSLALSVSSWENHFNGVHTQLAPHTATNCVTSGFCPQYGVRLDMNGRITSHHASVYRLMRQEANHNELLTCDVTVGM